MKAPSPDARYPRAADTSQPLANDHAAIARTGHGTVWTGT